MLKDPLIRKGRPKGKGISPRRNPLIVSLNLHGQIGYQLSQLEEWERQLKGVPVKERAQYEDYKSLLRTLDGLAAELTNKLCEFRSELLSIRHFVYQPTGRPDESEGRRRKE